MQLNKSIFLLILLAGTFVSAQISFKAIPDKTSARVGERIQLSFIITTSQDLDFEQVTFPSFSGFQMIGRNVGQNFSYTNGRMTKQFMETVILVPQKKGKYTVSGGSVMVDGKKYQSNSVTFNISEAAPKTKVQDSQLVFMEVILDKNKVYPNEHINAEIKLYAKSFDVLRRRSDLDVPGMSDFQVREISKNKDRDFEQEMINNQVYISESIAEYQLTPKSTGELVIPAFALRVAIPIDMFDERVVQVRSNHRSIDVVDFPANAPSIFKGAVGDFRLISHLDKNDVNTKESVNYEIELIGEGNFSSIILPKIDAPKDLEVYPSKTRNSFQTTSSGEKGKIVDRYVMVPQYGGVFNIPEIKFCYFNPKTEKYITITSDAQELKVIGETKQEALSNIEIAKSDSIQQDSTNSQKSILPEIPAEISNIFKKPKNDLSVDKQESSGSNSWWYAGLALPLIAGLVWFFAFRKPKDDKEDLIKDAAINSINLKSKLKSDLKDLKLAQQSHDKESFLRKANEILNDIVVIKAGEPKLYDVIEAKNILSSQVSNDYASRWEKFYNDIQSMSYGMATNGLDLQVKYVVIEDLVKESLK